MAKVLQIIDVDSDGHKIRLDDGRVVYAPHGGELPHIGQEFTEIAQPVSDDAPEVEEEPADEVKAPTIEQLDSDAQAQAQDLSVIVNQAETAE